MKGGRSREAQRRRNARRYGPQPPRYRELSAAALQQLANESRTPAADRLPAASTKGNDHE